MTKNVVAEDNSFSYSRSTRNCTAYVDLWAIQFKVNVFSGYPQTTPSLGGKRKGPPRIKYTHLPGGALHLCEGGSHCVTVNFYPLQLYLLLDNIVPCRLAWAAQPLACYQALQENFVSAPTKKEQTPRIRRKKKKKKSSPKPTTTQGDLIYPNPL